MSRGRAASRPGARPEPRRPDWVLGGLAAAGLLVAGSLAAAKLAAGSAPFCAAGSGCETVQTSR